MPAAASASFTAFPNPWNFAAAQNGLVSGLEYPMAAIANPSAGPASAVYVVDRDGASVFDYTPDGQALGSGLDLGQISFFGPGNDQNFCGPQGLAVDPATGDVYVMDTNDSAVEEFDPSGNLLAVNGSPNSAGCMDADPSPPPSGAFTSPTDATVLDGNLYVVGGGTVQYTPLGLGSAVQSFPLVGPGVASPTDIGDLDAVGIAADPRTGDLFVADANAEEVYEYTAAGAFLRVFATAYSGNPFSQLASVAVDPQAGVVYVGDFASGSGSGLVDALDETTGASLQQLPIPRYLPSSLSLDPVNHALYVVGQNERNEIVAFNYAPAPTCSAQSGLSAVAAIAGTLSLSCTDSNAPAVAYSIVSNPSHGTLSALNPATGAVTYTPNASYSGPDSFTFEGKSTDGTSQPATVSFEVLPQCAAETLATAYESPAPVSLVCNAPGDEYKIVNQPANGAVTGLDAVHGTLAYTPNHSFVGTDSFTYEAVSPGGQATLPATITINVGTQLPPPVQGQSANVYHSWGTVTILLPGQTTPIPLLAGMQVPLGSIIDATNGGVGIFVADNGQIQGADFWAGKFKLTQQGDPQTLLSLLGRKIPKVRCALHTKSYSGTFTLGAVPSSVRDSLSAQIAKKVHEKGKPSRQLWGSGHGNFTLVGHGSAAAVRGTEWAIFDYPDGTLTFDYTDSVSVRDFHLGKNIVVTAGHFYFAALGKLPPCK